MTGTLVDMYMYVCSGLEGFSPTYAYAPTRCDVKQVFLHK